MHILKKDVTPLHIIEKSISIVNKIYVQARDSLADFHAGSYRTLKWTRFAKGEHNFKVALYLSAGLLCHLPTI
jgi:hypothetical protein